MARVDTAPQNSKPSTVSQRAKTRRNIVRSAAIDTPWIYEPGFQYEAVRLTPGEGRRRLFTWLRHLSWIGTIHQSAVFNVGVKLNEFVPLSLLVRERRTSRKVRLWLTLLAGMLSQSATDSACGQTPAALDQEAWAVAEVMANKFQTAYNEGDVATIANLFLDNAYYFTPGGTVLYGWDRQAIQRAIAARIRAGWTKEIVKVTEAHSAGEAVWVTGEYSISGTGPNQGKQITGYFAQVITRNGGEWRLRIVIANLKANQDITGMSEIKGNPP
jgi:ketosteroid isomerase-like protein